jgi:hypothetical protein
MKPNALLWASFLGLAACAGHPLDCATGLVAWDDCAKGTAGYDRRHKMAETDRQKCADYGFLPGTDSYAKCVMELDQNRNMANDALLRSVVGGIASRTVASPAPVQAPASPVNIDCTTAVVGTVAYTNCHKQ